MEELQFKDIEISFDKENPQKSGVPIKISAKSNNKSERLEYKFIIGKSGIWSTIQEFSDNQQCIWSPKNEGEYIVMVQARDKLGKKPLDYFAKEDYIIDDNKSENNTNNITKDLSKKDDEFKKALSNVDERRTLLGAGELTNDERIFLNSSDNDDLNKEELLNDEVALDKMHEKDIDKNIIGADRFNDKKIESSLVIEDIIIDKPEITVGEKCTFRVKASNESRVLYRFFISKNDEWDMVRDYTTDNILKYTANECGEKVFLIQCKRPDSNEMFDDCKIAKVLVKNIEKAEIINFKTLNHNLIAGDELKFVVETNMKDNSRTLYKFYKISKNGKSSCIQDYSTKSSVSYVENQYGDYRILCCTKDILSNAEYDDRAILTYKVKPYKKISIKKFSTDLLSPQADGIDIKLKAEAEGGKKLLYRYIVKGTIESDSSFISNDQFSWKAVEPGQYEFILQVKDESFDGEYEDSKKIDFTIEKRGTKAVKIVDVVVDKEKNIVINDPVNIMVKAEGGTHLSYSFKINKDNKEISSVNYNKSNWINFTPKEAGDYEVEILIKDRYCRKEYDTHTSIHLKVLEYIPGEIDYIVMPCKANYVVGDTIEFECITQNTANVLIKYETQINGRSVEQTEFLKEKTLKVSPKIPGKYTINVYAKNIKCKKEYDSKKEITIRVAEAAPVMNTKIVPSIKSGIVNEEITFEASSTGGKEVCYEFYLMENEEWKKVQPYSRKNYYGFIPFVAGRYRILVFAKSYYKKVNYEDYDEFDFEVKGIEKESEKIK